jgi:hypothetical protein
MNRTSTALAESPDRDVTIRLSTAEDGDGDTIRRLASLDDGEPPRGPVMLAELDGEPVAALGIADGHAVADPLRSSPAIITLLRLRRFESRVIAAVWGV